MAPTMPVVRVPRRTELPRIRYIRLAARPTPLQPLPGFRWQTPGDSNDAYACLVARERWGLTAAAVGSSIKPLFHPTRWL